MPLFADRAGAECLVDNRFFVSYTPGSCCALAKPPHELSQEVFDGDSIRNQRAGIDSGMAEGVLLTLIKQGSVALPLHDDSSNSPNAAYLQLRGSRAQG